VWIWDSRTGEPIGRPLPHSGQIDSLYYEEWQGALLLVVSHSKFASPYLPLDSALWNMSVTPPALFSTSHLPVRSIPPPSLFKLNGLSNRTIMPSAGISFYFPPFVIFLAARDTNPSHEGKIAYAGWNGSAIIIDCSHLLPNSSAN
jgi:hypothetical protein